MRLHWQFGLFAIATGYFAIGECNRKLQITNRKCGGALLSAAAAELIIVVGKQDVEAATLLRAIRGVAIAICNLRFAIALAILLLSDGYCRCDDWNRGRLGSAITNRQ
ncbi:MAG TPA: hypothetical protein VFV98_04065 [Vicinamibacterales bacterium]|nr:hypothetical protein [Vicinamibacterales bacterium]